MFKLICKGCGKEFESKHSTQKFCTRRCAYDNKPIKHQDKKCLICGNLFHPETSTQKYCSHKCLGLAQRKSKSSICPICGKSFYSSKNKNQKYCSKECYTKSQTTIQEKHCIICGKIFKPRSNSGKYCSRECLAKGLSVPKGTKKIYIIECKQCGKEFETSKKDRKFCCNKCSTESHRIDDNICPVCGNRYHRTQPNQKYCCSECYGMDLHYKWVTLSDEEKKKILEPFLNSSRDVKSKINKEYEEYLKKIGFENIDTEFYLGGKYFDLKVGNILIEINPAHTHNSTIGPRFLGIQGAPKDKMYHYDKLKVARDSGYRCIMIWDWDDKKKIPYLLDGNKKQIYARKCVVKEISYESCYIFFDNYHLQGSTKKNKNNIYIGLYYNNELVECMSFGKPRYNKNYEWEILRLCTHKDYKVVGGANKIFKYFLDLTKANSIVSYCDMSKFDGGVYEQLGFKLSKWNKPSRHRIKDRGDKSKRHITDNFLWQHGYDQLFGTNYGKGTDNEELMRQNGYVEIYDCGQATFVWTRE